jgi:stage II sporulation protein M
VKPTIRPYLVALSVLFVVCLVAGLLAPADLRAPFVEGFRAWAAPYRQLPGPSLFVFIFTHNATAALASMLFGVVYGILPVVSVSLNGALLGMVARQASVATPAHLVLLKVLPHGVFELPALMIAMAHGLWLGQPRWGLPPGTTMPIGARLRFVLGRYLRLVLPLLLVAAAIEAFVVARIH